MGNCLRNNKISAQEFEPPRELGKTHAEADAVEETEKSAAYESKTATRREESKKKMVRFKLEDDDGGGSEQGSNCRSEPARIRLVVTREELRRILNYENDPENNISLEQLLSDIKFRGRRISEVGKDDDGITVVNPAWTPSLESIPEERSVK